MGIVHHQNKFHPLFLTRVTVMVTADADSSGFQACTQRPFGHT